MNEAESNASLTASPHSKRRFATSMRWSLLVSLLAFVSLGGFVGHWLFKLRGPISHPTEGPRWSVRGWHWEPASHRASFYGVNLTDEEREEGLSKASLTKVASNSDVEHVTLAYDATWKLDVSPLLQSKSIASIQVNCLSTSPELFEQLAVLKIKLQVLSGDFRGADLSPLCRSTAPHELVLLGELSAKAIESLSESDSLKSLFLSDGAFPPDDRPIARWPKSLSKLWLTNVAIDARDFDSLSGHSQLAELSAYATVLDDQALAAIASIPTLRSADLKIGKLSSAGLESLIQMNCDKLALHVDGGGEISLEEAQKLKQVKGLSQLDLLESPISNEVALALCELESLTELRITSPFVSQETILKLAKLPQLEWLLIPSTMRMAPLQAQINEDRQELNLPPLGLINKSSILAGT